jgi:hypothetical protein
MTCFFLWLFTLVPIKYLFYGCDAYFDFQGFFYENCKKGLFYEEEDVILCCVAGHDFYKSSKQKKRTLDLTDTCV